MVLNDRQQRVVRAVLPGADIKPVWINPLGGATYRVTDSGVSAYLKVAAETLPPSHNPVTEADRLRWVGDRFAVPHAIDTGRRDGYAWLLTADLGGAPASDREFADHPEQTARSLGQTLRAFHDALSTAPCPWSWQVQERYRGGRQTAEAAELLDTAPPETDRVVSRGDFCAPNVLLNRGELVPAVVDLGKLGIAARAADWGALYGPWSSTA